MLDVGLGAGVRFGVVYPQAFPGRASSACVSDVRRLLETIGYGSVELTHVDDASTRRSLRAVLERSGAACVFLGALPLLTAGLDLCGAGAQRDAAIELGRALVDEAYELGADTMLVTSGRDPGPHARARATDRLVDSVAALCEYARSRSGERCLAIALEPTDRALQHRQLIGPTAEAVDVVRRVSKRVPNVALHLDLSHLIQLGEDPAEALQLASHWCRHVHLSNCVVRDATHRAFGDGHPPFGLPGSEVGTPDLARFLQALRRESYLDPAKQLLLGVEVRPAGHEDPWVVLADATRAVRDACSLIDEASRPPQAAVSGC